MFGLGFSEVVFIGVIALLVVGPDKFPGFMKNLAKGVGQARRTFDSLKNEYEDEVDDIKKGISHPDKQNFPVQDVCEDDRKEANRDK